MKYSITCVCGDRVIVDAAGDEEAVDIMVKAMDQHVAATDHPEVPKDLTEGQKIAMVKEQMVEEQ